MKTKLSRLLFTLPFVTFLADIVRDDLRAANQEVFVLSPADSVAMLATAGRTESR